MEQVCDIHDSKYSFCFVHRISCCAECHGNAYNGCKIEDLPKAIAHFESDIRSKEEEMQILRGQLCGVSVMDMCNDKEKHLISELSKHFTYVRALVDKCEMKAMQQVKDIYLKKHAMGTHYDKVITALCGQIDRVSQEILKAHIPVLDVARTEPCPGAHEGAAAGDEGGTPGTSTSSSIDLNDDTKLVDRMSTISIQCTQVLSNSGSHLEKINTLSRSLSLTLQKNRNMPYFLWTELCGSCVLADGTSNKLMYRIFNKSVHRNTKKRVYGTGKIKFSPVGKD